MPPAHEIDLLPAPLALDPPPRPGARWRWPALPVREDWSAAAVSALLMLPQAVAFAVAAGLPPEMGIYTSVVPVIVAALCGASPVLLSGPNTAVSVMLGTALAPLAVPGSASYVALALTLTFMVGVLQLVASALGAGRLLARLPTFVSAGLTAGIGAAMIGTQVAPLMGRMAPPGVAPWRVLADAVAGAADANPWAVASAMSAIGAGAACLCLRRRWLPPLAVALAAGALVAAALDLLVGPATTGFDSVGFIDVTLLAPTMPGFDMSELYVFKQLLASACGIAMVGGLQTVIIARSLRAGGPCDPRRELLAQGLANVAASLTGGFAGSGSFNRTAAHVHAGARTRAAAVLCSVMLLAGAWVAAPVLARTAMPALAGTLVLIGWGMLRSGLRELRQERLPGRLAVVATVACVLAFGIESALVVATVAGLLCRVWGCPAEPSAAPPA